MMHIRQNQNRQEKSFSPVGPANCTIIAQAKKWRESTPEKDVTVYTLDAFTEKQKKSCHDVDIVFYLAKEDYCSFVFH